MDDFYGYGSYGPQRSIPYNNEYNNDYNAQRLDGSRQYEYHVDPSLPSFMSSYSVPASGTSQNRIYGQPLVDLSRATQHNIDRLKTKLVMMDPCYEFGIENWHSDKRKGGFVFPNFNSLPD